MTMNGPKVYRDPLREPSGVPVVGSGASGYTGNSRDPWPRYPMTAEVNHLTHMTLEHPSGCSYLNVAFYDSQMIYDGLEESDAYDDKQFALEMAKAGSSRSNPDWGSVRVRRQQRSYVCPRPCCGRQSNVSVYTDMTGVRKPTIDVRACTFCEVAWSVTLGKVICESATEVCETSPEDAAWDALLPPVLSPF